MVNRKSPIGTITICVLLSFAIAPCMMAHNAVDEDCGIPPKWTDDIPLCDYNLTNSWSTIGVSGENIHVVWVRDVVDVLYIKSIDGGLTWGSIQTLHHSSELARYPDIKVSGQNIHVVWDSRDGFFTINYRNSADGGETWNPVIQISSLDPNSNARGAQIYVNNSNIHVIWWDQRDGTDGEMYYRRSLDGGITFDNGQGIEEDRRLTFSPSPMGGVCIAGDTSNISVTWSDLRDGDLEKYWMISKDNGVTWEDGLGNPNIGRKLTDDTTDCGMGSIAVNGSNIHIVWEDSYWPGPVFYLYYRNSTDNGLTWEPQVLLSGPTPGIASPDMDVVGDNVYIVWDDRKDDGEHHEIYYKCSNDSGNSWTGDLRLTYNNTEWSLWPRISVENDTKHVVWRDKKTNVNHQIMYKRSPDFPDLSPPVHTNEIPLPDSYKDAPGTNVSVHVTDPSGLNESTIQLYVNGSIVSHNLSPITDGYNVSYESPGFDPGVVECRIVADDNLSNHLDFTWNFTVLAIYDIPLQEGWNLISVPHVQVDTSIAEVLRDIDGKWNYIQWYDASDPADKWKTNATYKPQQLNDLSYLNRSMAFWINITEPNVNLTVRGHLSTFTEIQLYAGWNLVGYSTQTTETIANALWGTGADRVEVFDPVEPYLIREVGPEYVMKPGEGYWVHVPVNTVWIVNW